MSRLLLGKGLNQNFVMVPYQLLSDARLSSTEKIVLIALLSFANPNHSTVWPSYKTIAERSGSQRRSVIRTIGALIEKGYVLRETRRSKSKGNSSNTYVLTLPEHSTEDETGDKMTLDQCQDDTRCSDKMTPELYHLEQNKEHECMNDVDSHKFDLSRIESTIQTELARTEITTIFNEPGMASDYTKEIMTALIRSRRTDATKVLRACEVFRDRVDDYYAHNLRFMEVKNPPAFFIDCYKEAEQLLLLRA